METEDVNDWGLDFSIMEKDEDGKIVTVDLKPGGQQIELTNDNKKEYMEVSFDKFFSFLLFSVSKIY